MREMANRIFAAEFNSSNYELREGEEKSSVYVVTPLGAKVNRLLLMGVLTEIDSRDTEGGKLYTAQVTDPTGTFRVSAGQYQEYASKALQSLTAPAFVAVVGKARTYTPEEGTVYVSVRAEEISLVTQEQKDFWIYETCRETSKRISAMKAAFELMPPNAESIARMGVPRRLADGAALAALHYKQVDLATYRGMVVEALRSLPGIEEATGEVMPGPVAETAAAPGEELTEEEEKMLLIIGELDTSTRGAEWDAVIQSAKGKQLTEEQINAAVEGLLDKGMIYEPVLGRMKRI